MDFRSLPELVSLIQPGQRLNTMFMSTSSRMPKYKKEEGFLVYWANHTEPLKEQPKIREKGEKKPKTKRRNMGPLSS